MPQLALTGSETVALSLHRLRRDMAPKKQKQQLSKAQLAAQKKAKAKALAKAPAKPEKSAPSKTRKLKQVQAGRLLCICGLQISLTASC